MGPRPPVSLKYKLLALDLDGTILGLDLSLDPSDVEAVRRMSGAGMQVIAITNTHPAAELGQADYVVSTYEEVERLLLHSAATR